MGTLNLSGKLNLTSSLTLKDRVVIDGEEALVVLNAPTDAPHTTKAAPVIMPPPPGSPVDTGTQVWVISSFNTTVMAGSRALVTQGMVIQGNLPTWPGMVLPGTKQVTINWIAINIKGDKASIFPFGASVVLDTSGQP